MNPPLHPALRPTFEIAGVMADAAESTIRATVRAIARGQRARRASARGPGPGTPLWNEVVTATEPYLRKRGSKANLGRYLGVPRQRVHDYFVGRTSSPDAERLLLLLHWLAVQMPERSAG